MKIQVSSQPGSFSTDAWGVIFVRNGENLIAPSSVPPKVREYLELLHEQGDLPQKTGEVRKLYGIEGREFSRLLLINSGSAAPADQKPGDQYQNFSIAARALCDQPKRNVVWFLPDGLPQSGLELAATVLTMAPQSQGLYQQEPKRHPYASITLITDPNQSTEVESSIHRGDIVGRAINLTRELINRGPHEVGPDSFARRAGQVAAQVGLTCRIFDEQQLRAEKMNSLLAVAKGSDYEPRMVVLEYRGAGDAPFVGLVGKGVTYDSGGLSLKPSDSMKTMKSDMSGAATVLGTMQAVAELKLPVNVRGYLGLVENMISGSSYRLGDVLTARNGVTIEVLNTDAEGRLVLADVLCYAVDEGCSKLVDLATLTGACVVALGEEYTGVMTNDQKWCDQFFQATKTTGEKAWQLPMCDSFGEQLRSDVADCKNIGSRWGGAITAAKFLEKFVDDTPWIHLDIAGPAFLTDNKPHREGGASGVMVRTMLALLQRLCKA